MIKINSFPKDSQEWLVLWHGAVRKNSHFSINPLVEVLLSNLSTGKPEYRTYTVNITELDIVRLGTVWKNQVFERKLYTAWGHRVVTESFFFDLEENKPKSINYISLSPSDNERYISPLKFPLPPSLKKENNHPDHPYYQFSYNKAKLNVLRDDSGRDILISALETLTSLYTPSRKSIRRDVLTKSVDDILNTYVRHSEAVEAPQGERYRVEYKDSSLGITPKVFLAHLALNKPVQDIIKRVQQTLEIADLNEHGDPYTNRYPEILPYHTKYLEFEAEGVWLDEDHNRFLVLRVTKVKAPSEVPVVSVSVVQNYKDEELDPSDIPTRTIVRTITEASEMIVDNDQDPGRNNGKSYILTEVESISEEGLVTKESEKINVETPDFITGISDKKEVVNRAIVSSGESYGSTSGSRQLENQGNDKTESIDQINVLKDVYQALVDIKDDPDKSLVNVSCISGNGCEVDGYHLINIKKILPEDKENTWLSKGSGRRIMLVKLEYNRGSPTYILEIERMNSNESFMGFYLDFSRRVLDESVIYELADLIVSKKGTSSWLGKFDSLSGKESFKHTKGVKTWKEKMESIILKPARRTPGINGYF